MDVKSLQLFKETVAPTLPQIGPDGETLSTGLGNTTSGISIK
jgi:hypothetical protein